VLTQLLFLRTKKRISEIFSLYDITTALKGVGLELGGSEYYGVRANQALLYGEGRLIKSGS
jgi:hypothetical protein